MVLRGTTNTWRGLLLTALLTTSLAACNGRLSENPNSDTGEDGKGTGGQGNDGGKTEDTTGPTVAITEPSASGTHRTALASIDIEGSAEDDSGVASVTWKNTSTGATGTAKGTAMWTAAGVALDEGENSIEVTATDTVGNRSVASILITSDRTGPSLTVTTPSSAELVTSTALLEVAGTAADPAGVASIGWRNTTTGATGTASGTTAWSAADVSLTEGPNHIELTATDALGNTSVASLEVTLDTEPPTLAITSPAPEGRLVGTASTNLAGTSADLGGVVSVTWKNLTTGAEGTASGTTHWSITDVPLEEGENEIQVTVTDVAGRTTSDSVTITSDRTGPSLAITSPTGSGLLVSEPTVAVTGTAADPSGVDAVAWRNLTSGTMGSATGTSSWSVSDVPLVSGANEIEITATDSLGNSATTSITVLSDGDPPAVTITSPTGEGLLVATTPISLSGTASDVLTSVASVTFRNEATGASGTASGTTEWSVTGVALVEGANEIVVTATDTLGNASESSVTVTLDTGAPTLVISSPSAGDLVAATTVDVLGTASDPFGIASVTWKNVTTGATGTASGTTTWTASAVPLVEGANSLDITVTDRAGNVTRQTIPVVSDVTGPTLTITNPSEAGPIMAFGPSIEVSGIAADLASVDRVTWANLTTGASGDASGAEIWSVAAIPLANGLNTIRITAYDSVGNASSQSIVVNFNHAPTSVSLNLPGGHFLLPGIHQEGVVAARVTAVDPDPDNVVTFELDSSGEDSESFSLASNGDLTPLFTPDPSVKSSYAIRIQATDNYGASETFDKTVFVSEGANTFVFGTCGRTSGREGPTAADCEAAYAGTNLEAAVSVPMQGYQRWVVPATGSYYVVAAGASGGDGNDGDGGHGAVMRGSFELSAGDVLTMVVGQRGSNRYHSSPGGGGGTFVVKGDPTSTDILTWANEPVRLLIAAGGGAGGTCAVKRTGLPGVTGPSGSSNATGERRGGSDGSGGEGTQYASGGAGFRGNGEGVRPPLSFLNGATGGESDGPCLWSASTTGGDGGFGGGAGGNVCEYLMCGAAGGYSGGGAGYPVGGDAYTAGGGGSYNAGAAQLNASGANGGAGFVHIIQLP